MADTYADATKARRIEQDGYDPAWSTRFNEDVIDIFDAGIGATKTIDIGSSTSYSLAAMQNGTLSDSHYLRLRFIGTPASAVTVTVPASVVAKLYVIENNVGQRMTLKYSASVGIHIESGARQLVYCDGSEVYRVGIDDARSYKGISRAPAGLGHMIGDFLYRRKNNGEAELLADLSGYLPAGALDPFDVNLIRYYVDPDAGNDANSGANWANALKTVTQALGKSDVDVVLCKGGTTYKLTSGTVTTFPNYSGARDVAVIAIGKPALMTTAANITSWTVDGVLTNTYESSSTSGTVVRVVDTARRDANGDYFALTNVASQALVDATEDSWFYDGANVVSVNLSTGAPSVTTTLALKVAEMRVSADAVKVYIKNMHFLGGSSGAFGVRDTGVDTTFVTFEDCWFCHQYQLHGLQVLDCGMTICINCRASANATDGFNYQTTTSVHPHFIEIGCVGIANSSLSSSNGSSAHDDCRGIRLNCDYFANSGPGLVDVNTSKSLNVNITSCGQTGFTTNSRGIQSGNTAEIWVDGASCSDNDGADMEATNTAIIHYRDIHLEDGQPVKAAGATLDADFS